ncbi:MAG: nucleotide-binding protein [Chloroflexi bacterium]|nr:nucleotide-binding protein [Chloroflexota bacterium]
MRPFYSNLPIVINGKSLSQNEIDRIRISDTEQSAYEMWPTVKRNLEADNQRIRDGDDPLTSMMARRYPFLMQVSDQQVARAIMNAGKNVSNDLLTSNPDSGSTQTESDGPELSSQEHSRNVFVVHGRNGAAREAMFTFLRTIGLHPIEWSEAVKATGGPNPYVGQVLQTAFSLAGAVLVLFTPDDEAWLKPHFRRPDDPSYETSPSGQARPNVLFEAGMAMGGNENRTVLVELGTLRPFSDIAGRHVIRLDDSPGRRQELAQRLGSAGCPVNLDGTDWYRAGEFEAALEGTESRNAQVLASNRSEGSADAQFLLLCAAQSNDGSILMLVTQGGSTLRVGGQHFGELGDRRSEARWGEALRVLVESQLVEDATGMGRLFQVTHRGFQVADGLSNSA